MDINIIKNMVKVEGDLQYGPEMKIIKQGKRLKPYLINQKIIMVVS